MVQTAITTMLQEKTDTSMQGRVLGLLGTMYAGFLPDVYKRQDEYGNTHMVVDETLRRRMETRLIAKILSFEIREPK